MTSLLVQMELDAAKRLRADNAALQEELEAAKQRIAELELLTSVTLDERGEAIVAAAHAAGFEEGRKEEQNAVEILVSDNEINKAFREGLEEGKQAGRDEVMKVIEHIRNYCAGESVGRWDERDWSMMARGRILDLTEPFTSPQPPTRSE